MQETLNNKSISNTHCIILFNYLYIWESQAGWKKSAVCVQSLDVVKIRRKDKFYVFTELPFKKCKGYAGGGGGKQMALGKGHTNSNN